MKYSKMKKIILIIATIIYSSFSFATQVCPTLASTIHADCVANSDGTLTFTNIQVFIEDNFFYIANHEIYTGADGFCKNIGKSIVKTSSASNSAKLNLALISSNGSILGTAKENFYFTKIICK